ncbi:MAG: alpha/beta hydrolase [Chloroflexi bacterium]|nr:alpha/beta hydrolase [Chloroflexota bacterium]
MKRIGDLTIPHIAALYAGVPADRLEQFQAFRRAFPYRDLILDGVTWSYLTGGQGEPPVLLLSGALAIPDISWNTIVNCAARRRVMVPAYPPVPMMAALADGIAAVLRREGVEQVHVMGGSYGGFVAQVFARRHPQMTRSLVLSHTQPPYPEMAPRMRRFARLLRWLPMGLVRQIMRRTFRSMLPERSAETACLLAVYDELIGYALGKEDAVAILERMADFSAQAFAPQDLAGWPGKVLLVFGTNDPATPPDVRERLASLYPGCQVHLFEGTGHTASVIREDEYLAVIDGFLAQA